MHFFNLLEKNAVAGAMNFRKPVAVSFKKICRWRDEFLKNLPLARWISKGEQADFCTSEVQKYEKVQRSTKKYKEVQEVRRSIEKYQEAPRSTKKYKKYRSPLGPLVNFRKLVAVAVSFIKICRWRDEFWKYSVFLYFRLFGLSYRSSYAAFLWTWLKTPKNSIWKSAVRDRWFVFLRDSNVTSSLVVNLTDGNRYKMTFLKITG